MSRKSGDDASHDREPSSIPREQQTTKSRLAELVAPTRAAGAITFPSDRTRLADIFAASPAKPSLFNALSGVGAKPGSAYAEALSRSMATQEVFGHEVASLRKQVAEKAAALEKAQVSGGRYAKKNEELESALEALRLKEDLAFLLTRVSPAAQQKLLADEAFRGIFSEDRECNAFVMSVDIRRSTELMLKARSPSLFADFISHLTKALYECVVNNNGVFDKFTGDGVLAFFPEGFSGPDSGYSVLRAATDCHAAFESIYRDSRSSFTSVLKGIGLGIGVDFGPVRLLRVAEGLTVVGVPVVYACRLSGALPGQTLLNQPAYEVVHRAFGQSCTLEETSIQIKHEGEVVAYSASLGHERLSPRTPDWMECSDPA